jgi:hypothetical protein
LFTMTEAKRSGEIWCLFSAASGPEQSRGSRRAAPTTS